MSDTWQDVTIGKMMIRPYQNAYGPSHRGGEMARMYSNASLTS